MEQIKRFFECLVPVTACNLKCSYCYIIQRNQRKLEIPELKYSIENIGYALRKERLGGVCYFSICGAGETLMADHIVELVEELLRQGHYVNITTNGTLTKQFIRLCQMKQEYLERLHVSFSFHYLELKRINKIDEFFENVLRIKQSGSSILVQFNLCDEYEPYLDEINYLCIDKVGASPQVAPTRDEIDLMDNIKLYTRHSLKEYYEMGKKFQSPLFNFNMQNFNVKHRKFCYAGDWTGVLNFNSGMLHKCYFYGLGGINVFENPDSEIDFTAVGKCGSPYCMNSSHFLSLGVIPDLFENTTYEDLRNRKDAFWYNSNMQEVLSHKLLENNKQYGKLKRKLIYSKTSMYVCMKFWKHKIKSVIKR